MHWLLMVFNAYEAGVRQGFTDRMTRMGHHGKRLAARWPSPESFKRGYEQGYTYLHPVDIDHIRSMLPIE